MLFVTKHKHNILGEIMYICGYIDPNSNNECYSLKEILTNPTLCSKLRLDRDYTFLLKKQNNFILPTVLQKDIDSEESEVIYLTGEFGLDELVLEDKFTEVYSLTKEIIGEINEDDFISMLSASYDGLEMLVNNSFKYRMPLNIDTTSQKIIQQYNSQSHGEFIDYSAEKRNVIAFKVMTNPTDDLIMTMPKAYYKKDTDLKDIVDAQLKKLFAQYEVFTPYPVNARLNYTTYMNYPEIDLRDILGHDDNNKLPLQKNEQVFYDRICKFIDDYLQLYCSQNNLDIQYVKDNCIFQGTEMETVLEYIIRIFVNKNWSHSSEVPLNEFSGVDGSGDSDSDSDDDSSVPGKNEGVDKLEYAIESRFEAGKKFHHDYYAIIRDFILQNKCTIYAFAEVIIKLARWGSRKPTHLVLDFPKSNSLGRTELDLTSMKTDFTDESIESMSFGDKQYLISGIITVGDIDIPLVDEPEIFNKLQSPCVSKIPKDTIIGVQVLQPIKINNETKHRLIVMDLVTFINQQDNIDGVEFNNGAYEALIDIDRVNHHKLYLTDVNNYINSNNKTLMQFINDNALYMSFGDFKRDDLKLFTMFSFANITISQCSVKPFLGSTPVAQVLGHMSKLFLSYFSDILDESRANGTTPKLLESLEIFRNNYYNAINDIKSFSVNTKEDATLQKTNLFNKSEESKKERVVTMLNVSDNYRFYVCNSEQAKANGCNNEIFKLKEDRELELLDLTNIGKTQEKLRALHSVCALYLDTKHQNKIFMSDDTKTEVENMLFQLYKTKDVLAIYIIICDRLQPKK